LVLAGLAGLTVAGFRTNCPAGAAGCGSAGNDPPADLAQLTHGYAVVTYEIAIVVAMLIVAGGLFARHRPALAALTVAIAALSVLLALQIGGSDTGWWQRGWLLVNTGWLVALVLTTTRPSRSTPPVPPG
jgi:urea transporter